MTPAEAAAKLDDNEYGKEGSDELFAEMKGAGLVAVFGSSDDLIEMRGAIDDEGGAYGGATAHVTPAGLVQNECENDACPHFIVAKRNAAKIKAIWDDGGFSWRYRTDIPHATFVIKEDGENYCEGIVFALADVQPSVTGETEREAVQRWERTP